MESVSVSSCRCCMCVLCESCGSLNAVMYVSLVLRSGPEPLGALRWVVLCCLF